TGQLPDERPYLAMERLEGETLASLITKGALPLGRALPLFSELCSAVAALHDQGLVHRDLKPENVFVVGDRHAVLLDFGIAKELGAPASTTTQQGAVRGTPAYMAPERFFGQAASIATDLYELAVIFYAVIAAGGTAAYLKVRDRPRAEPAASAGVGSQVAVAATGASDPWAATEHVEEVKALPLTEVALAARAYRAESAAAIHHLPADTRL